MARKLTTLSALAVIGLGVMATGCKDDAPDAQVLTLSGTVEKIDLAKRRVKISFHSEKHGRNLTQEAEVNDRTEVFINGIAARLEDVKEGERADGEVVVSKRDGERVITITKVQIGREEAIAAQPAPKREPAEIPAPKALPSPG